MQKLGVIAAGHSLGLELMEKLIDQVQVRAIVRIPDKLQKKLMASPLAHRMNQLEIVQADLEDPQTLSAALEGCDKVVCLAHAQFAPNILKAALSLSSQTVKKIVLVGSTWKFTKFKNERAELVRRSEDLIGRGPIPFAFIHPSMIYGIDEEKTITRLCHWLRKYPLVPLPDGGRTLVQPAFSADIVDALVASVLDSRTDNQSYIVAAHQPITYRAVVETAGRLLNRPALILPIPSKLLRLIASFLSFTPWANRLRPDQVDRLTEDKKFDVSPIERILNRPLRTFAEGLSEILQRENGPKIK